MEDTETIENLRGRLARRNTLLEIIRKAYHRDVIAIKNHLSSLLVDASALSSLPSLDLRECGFLLFAPQECELRVRPCNECGGELEIIHRESSRIVQYKHTIQQMEEREIDMRIELIDTKAQAKKDRDRLVEEMRRGQNERVALTKQVEYLKSQLSNRDADIERLEEAKHGLELKLEQQQPIIVEHQQLVVEIQTEKDEKRRWKENFHEQMAKANMLQQEHESVLRQLEDELSQSKRRQLALEEMQYQRNIFEDRASNLATDLAATQRSEKEYAESLHQAERQLDELKSIFVQEREELGLQIHNLEQSNKQLSTEVNELHDLSRRKTSECDSLLSLIDEILEGAKGRGSIAVIPSAVEDKFSRANELISEYAVFKQKTKTLSHLLISCIRVLFDTCSTQETILRTNDSELHKSLQINALVDIPNEKSRLVLGHLENGAASDTIDWLSIINNEEDRNHVLGSLQSRQQTGLFSINKAFEKKGKHHDRVLSKCRHNHKKEREKMQDSMNQLEQQLSQSTNAIRKYEDKMIKLQEKYALGVVPLLTSTQDLLLTVRKEFTAGSNTFSKLKEDYLGLRCVTARVLDALRESKETMRSQSMTIEQRDDDIIARDTAISHFEEMLTKITHKYAENERRRLARGAVEVGVQASSSYADASTQIDFLLQQGDKLNIPPREQGQALLPGRIFQLQIRDNLSKLQLRRAIDKL